MKLGVLLIILGIALFIDGTLRVGMGFIALPETQTAFPILGGIVTGWLLGIWVIYRGIKRIRRIRSSE